MHKTLRRVERCAASLVRLKKWKHPGRWILLPLFIVRFVESCEKKPLKEITLDDFFRVEYNCVDTVARNLNI